MGINTEEIIKGPKKAMRVVRKLVNRKGGGGKKRRDILGYIARYPECTAYEIAKEIYGDPLTYYKTVVFHLEKLREVSKQLEPTEWGALLDEKKRELDGAVLIKLTDAGKDLCILEGIEAPSGRVNEFIEELHHKLSGGLERDQVKKLRKLLNDDVFNTATEIEMGAGGYPLPKLELLYAVWYYGKMQEFKNWVSTEEFYKSLSSLFPKQVLKKAIKNRVKVEKAIIKLLSKLDPTIQIVEKYGVKQEFDELFKFFSGIIPRDQTMGKILGEASQNYSFKIMMPHLIPALLMNDRDFKKYWKKLMV